MTTGAVETEAAITELRQYGVPGRMLAQLREAIGIGRMSAYERGKEEGRRAGLAYAAELMRCGAKLCDGSCARCRQAEVLFNLSKEQA